MRINIYIYWFYCSDIPQYIEYDTPTHKKTSTNRAGCKAASVGSPLLSPCWFDPFTPAAAVVENGPWSTILFQWYQWYDFQSKRPTHPKNIRKIWKLFSQ